jgi:hypothetical protein
MTGREETTAVGENPDLAPSNAVIAVTASELREKSTTAIDDVFG